MLNTLRKDLEKYLDDLWELNTYLYHHPELAYEEHLASKAHTDLLKKHGFQIQHAPLGLETAYVARFKGDKPGRSIGYLAEYDALPGIGHGCAHNLLGTTSLGAALLLKDYVEEFGGEVILYGTPGEEAGGAKVAFADNGLFDEVDVALCAHPSDGYYAPGRSMELVPLTFTFKGRTSHAASDPHKGINALDALLLTFNNINALREHLLPEARVHGIVKEGGLAANVVPERAVGEFYVRSMSAEYIGEVVEKVINCAKAGALATGCELVYEKGVIYRSMRNNAVLAERFRSILKEQGKQTLPPRESFGSLDMGNVSQVAPAIHPYFPITPDPIPAHSVEFRDASLTDYAREGMITTIVTLVKTAIDLNEEEGFYRAVVEEFQKK